MEPSPIEPTHPLHRASLSLAAEAASACLLDDQLRIVAVNAAWDAFARANGGAERCLGAVVVGSDYLAHVGGLEPRVQVEGELARALRGSALSADSECSSTELFRLLRTHYLPVHAVSGGPVQGLLLVHSLVEEGPMAGRRRRVEPSEEAHRGPHGLIEMCSSCRRTRRVGAPGTWDYVPAYVARLPARVTHGMCAACLVQYGISPQEVEEITARRAAKLR